jgi:hypothetical protein
MALLIGKGRIKNHGLAKPLHKKNIFTQHIKKCGFSGFIFESEKFITQFSVHE